MGGSTSLNYVPKETGPPVHYWTVFGYVYTKERAVVFKDEKGHMIHSSFILTNNFRIELKSNDPLYYKNIELNKFAEMVQSAITVKPLRGNALADAVTATSKLSEYEDPKISFVEYHGTTNPNMKKHSKREYRFTVTYAYAKGYQIFPAEHPVYVYGNRLHYQGTPQFWSAFIDTVAKKHKMSSAYVPIITNILGEEVEVMSYTE